MQCFFKAAQKLDGKSCGCPRIRLEWMYWKRNDGLRYWFFLCHTHRYWHGEHCCALCRLLTELCIRMRGTNLLTSDFNPLPLLFQGGAGGLLNKRAGPDALHQHWRRLLLPAPVHRLHPGHAGLPPQGGGQAAGLLQRGQGGCRHTDVKRPVCGSGRGRWCHPTNVGRRAQQCLLFYLQQHNMNRTVAE